MTEMLVAVGIDRSQLRTSHLSLYVSRWERRRRHSSSRGFESCPLRSTTLSLRQRFLLQIAEVSPTGRLPDRSAV
jgi:hypothetical protein